MYNDEHNLYHYTYRKDGSEAEAHSAPQPGPVQDHNSGPQQPVQEMKPVKSGASAEAATRPRSTSAAAPSVRSH